MIEQWSTWALFPDAQNRGFLFAPFGPGVYEVRRKDTGQLIYRGKGKNCAARMTSLMPLPYGQGGRSNAALRQYVAENLYHLEYRCCACQNEFDASHIESTLNRAQPSRF